MVTDMTNEDAKIKLTCLCVRVHKCSNMVYRCHGNADVDNAKQINRKEKHTVLLIKASK